MRIVLHSVIAYIRVVIDKILARIYFEMIVMLSVWLKILGYEGTLYYSDIIGCRYN